MTTGQKVAAQLDELDAVREDFIDNLETKGITGLIGDEKLDELTPKILDIPSVTPGSSIDITQNGTIDISNYETANVSVKYKPRTYTFYLQSTVSDLLYETQNVDTSLLTSMNLLFDGCNALRSIDIHHFNTSNVTDMGFMFAYCKVIPSSVLDFSNFNTSKVNTFQAMFSNCLQITSLDLSTFTSKPNIITSQMFANCTRLTYLDMRNFDFTNITTYGSMFGSNATSGPPDNCLIIVKDAASKNWITSKFSRLTNVKTVSEYEAEQGGAS